MPVLNFLGNAAAGLNAAQDESSRLFKEAMAESDAVMARAKNQMQGLQARGQILVDQGRDAEAAAMIPQIGSAFNKAYGVDLPTQKVHGTPVMARGMDQMEQLGPAMPGKLMPKVPVASPYMYDTGARTFDLPEQKAAIRGGLLLPKVKPDYEQLDPYKITIDNATGKIVRPADSNPYRMTAEDQAALRREGYGAAEARARLMGGYGLERTRMTTTTSAANNAASNATRTGIASQNNANDLDVAGLNIGGRLAVAGINNTARTEAAAIKAEAERVKAERKKAERRDVDTSRASFVMAKNLGQAVPGASVASIGAGGVISVNLPRSANGGEDQTVAAAVAARARANGYQFTPGANGQSATLRPLPGAHSAALREQLMLRGNGDGTSTVVVKETGVVSKAPPPKPGEDPADKRRTERQRAWSETRSQAITQANATAKPGRAPTEAEIERIHQRLFDARMQAGEEPAAPRDAAAELVELMRADKAAKKKGGR